MKSIKVVTATCAGAALIALGSGAASAQYDGGGLPPTTPPASPIATVTASPGETLDLTGTKCASNSAVAVTMDGASIGSGTANAMGSFVARVTVPSNSTLTNHRVIAKCTPAGAARINVAPASSGFGLNRAASIAAPAKFTKAGQAVRTVAMTYTGPGTNELNVNVVAAGSGGGGGGSTTSAGTTPLARTGSNVLPLVGIAGAALLLGGAFVYGARKPSEA